MYSLDEGLSLAVVPKCLAGFLDLVGERSFGYDLVRPQIFKQLLLGDQLFLTGHKIAQQVENLRLQR
jgi:hypothetical protein